MSDGEYDDLQADYDRMVAERDAAVRRAEAGERQVARLILRLERVRDGWHEEEAEEADLNAAASFLAAAPPAAPPPEPQSDYDRMRADPRSAALLEREERKLAVTERLAEMGFHVPDDEGLDRLLNALAAPPLPVEVQEVIEAAEMWCDEGTYIDGVALGDAVAAYRTSRKEPSDG
jgi:hypothetical protein